MKSESSYGQLSYAGVYDVAGNGALLKDAALAMPKMEKKLKGSLEWRCLRVVEEYACQRGVVAGRRKWKHRGKDIGLVEVIDGCVRRMGKRVRMVMS
jgi:hypothetical protein